MSHSVLATKVRLGSRTAAASLPGTHLRPSPADRHPGLRGRIPGRKRPRTRTSGAL